MMKVRTTCCMAALWAGFLCGGSAAVAVDYPRASLLVEPSQLARESFRQRFHVLDARDRSQYEAAHVPGALWVDHGEWATQFGDGDDIADWSERLGRLGLRLNRPVVVYDDNKSKDAARIWWILRYWGFEDVRLLNGGWRAWQAARLPAESGERPRVEVTAPKLRPAPQRLATKQEILAALPEGSLQIIDARSEAEYCGTEPLANKRAGAIPGAKHLEWSDLIDPETHRFKSPAELERLFREAGIRIDRPTATHCQSGGRASVMAFALELMGARDVSNYYRSWAEWGNAEDTPIEPGKPRTQ